MKINCKKKRPLKFLQIKTSVLFSVSPLPTLSMKYFLPSFYTVQGQFVRFKAGNINLFQILDLIKSTKKWILVVYETAENGYPPHPIPTPRSSVALSSLEKVKCPMVCRLALRHRRLKGAKLQQCYHADLALGPDPEHDGSTRSFTSSPSQISSFQSNVCSEQVFML